MNPSASAKATSAPSEKSFYERVYPKELCKQEASLIKARRLKNGKTDTTSDRETVASAAALACSGGGIRSATFCLGVAQAIAQTKVGLKPFDFLSTVSGGGYFGCFLGALIQRRGSPDKAQEELKTSESWTIRWLRESGYYLAPGGSADGWMIASMLLRNWVAIHVVLMSVLFLPFLLGIVLRGWLWNFAGWNALEHQYHFICGSAAGDWCVSPWFLFTAAAFVVGMFIPGLFYWFTQFISNPKLEAWLQNKLTHWLAMGALLTTFLGLTGVMDTLGFWIYAVITQSRAALTIFAGIYAAAAAAFGWVQKIGPKLAEFKGKDKEAKGVSMFTIAKIAGLLWAAMFWLSLAVGSHAWLWQGVQPTADVQNLAKAWPTNAAWFGGWLAVVLLTARIYSFVNLSSLHRYYSSRLGRAYLGASNEKRQEPKAQSVAEPHDDDDMLWKEYQPHACGGPLHLLNTTLNETVSAKSQIEQQDRKGLSMCVGPAGLSVGREHHALWDRTKKSSRWNGDAIQSLETPADFRIFDGGGRFVESLNLSEWMGISGAAFSPGMGAQTSLGLSLLLTLANVRLGYWWNSGVAPHKRNPETKTRKRVSQLLGGAFAWLFPVPSSLLDEMFSRFHGPARQRWYLSDGGHYENTACYELIRRRVGFILCLDCGQDPALIFEDVGNLVRKARIDYNADVVFVSGEEARAALSRPEVPAPYNAISPEWIALPQEIKSAKSLTAREQRHAMLARVSYDGGISTGTTILFIKPVLTGEESLDVRQYRDSNPDFPQQTTMDQFFDESQWESYRELGFYTMQRLFSPFPKPSSASESTEPTT